jgi:hypothetical protein
VKQAIRWVSQGKEFAFKMLTPWSEVLLEKLLPALLFKKPPHVLCNSSVHYRFHNSTPPVYYPEQDASKPIHCMLHYGLCHEGEEVWLHAFITTALGGCWMGEGAVNVGKDIFLFCLDSILGYAILSSV